jgi:hypothetical protein
MSMDMMAVNVSDLVACGHSELTDELAVKMWELPGRDCTRALRLDEKFKFEDVDGHDYGAVLFFYEPQDVEYAVEFRNAIVEEMQRIIYELNEEELLFQ